MDDIFNNIIEAYPNPNTCIDILINIFSNSGYDKTTKTIENSETYSILRIYCLAYISYVIPSIDFTSSSDSINLISRIKPLFESELTDALISGDTFSWLSRIYTKCLTDISTRGSLLPQINSFYSEYLPVPVVAQYLYQDGSRDDEIIIRNNEKIIHPLFYNGQLEVLSE
ncbi:hypothetical protein KBX73_02990 [Acetobacter persici]|uniref:hypothetical protein n=1 Tax=Acetobacter persici TaxID=1076596 RepID=UPI0020CF6276|nr:hypothetical protein [Acetobacter persici]MCP9318757.1 hypothetical protein [Acetobacter persici]